MKLLVYNWHKALRISPRKKNVVCKNSFASSVQKYCDSKMIKMIEENDNGRITALETVICTSYLLKKKNQREGRDQRVAGSLCVRLLIGCCKLPILTVPSEQVPLKELQTTVLSRNPSRLMEGLSNRNSMW